MSAAGTFDIRRIVEQARALTAEPAPVPEHPIGLGLRSKHFLRPNEGQPRVRLPKRAEGLRQINEIISREILDLDQHERQVAWRILLGQPSLCAPIRAPTVSELMELGFPVPEAEGPWVRAVALAAVYQRETATKPDTNITGIRFAGVGRLVVVTEEKNPEVSVNAWADVRWVVSERALSRGMEFLYNKASISIQQGGRRRSAALLLGDDLADSLDADTTSTVQNDLSAIAAVHGFNLQVLRRPRSHAGTILDHVRRTPPRLLVIAAPQEPKVEDIINTYRATGVTPHVYQLGARLPEEMLEDFREIMGLAAGINPGLFPITFFSESSEEEYIDSAVPAEAHLVIPGIWPVPNPGRRLFHPAFRRVIENLADGYWYTRDLSEHANSRVKQYRLEARILYHVSDIDAEGKAISKHKGAVGAIIRLDDMRGI